MNATEFKKVYGISKKTLEKMEDLGLVAHMKGGYKEYQEDEVWKIINVRRQGIESKLSPKELYTGKRLNQEFNANLQGGMKKLATAHALFLLLDYDADNLYSDYWDVEDVLHYTRAGLDGNQKLSHQNLDLAKSNQWNIALYLFESYQTDAAKNPLYRYRGRMKLVGDYYIEKAKDINDLLRDVIVFPLKPLDELNELPAEVVREYQDRELYFAKKKGNLTKEKWLKRLAEIEQKQSRHKEWVQPVSKVVEYIYNWSTEVKEYTLQRAQGRCELCGNEAPFYVEGNPFLECHHIQWLSKGGRDFPDNTAALCPNCHRKLHHLKDKSVLDAEIKRLRKNISINEVNMI